MPEIIATLYSVTRLASSANGNPRWRLQTSEGDFVTGSDATIGYEAKNHTSGKGSMIGREVVFTVTNGKTPRVTGMRLNTDAPSDMVARFINDAGRLFAVRVIPPGGGRVPIDPCIEAGPLVEFFDTVYAGDVFGPLGQFIARYYASTLLGGRGGNRTDGLNLYGGESDWFIDAYTMSQIRTWVGQVTAKLENEG